MSSWRGALWTHGSSLLLLGFSVFALGKSFNHPGLQSPQPAKGGSADFLILKVYREDKFVHITADHVFGGQKILA